MHRAEEDYLKIIYKHTIEADLEVVKTSVIANIMHSTNQTVNEMVRRLAKKKMATFLRYKGIKLTAEGLIEAIKLVRNHRLWEVFLVQKLNYSWITAHDEAEKLEHVSSDYLMDKIDKLLDYPQYCIHGNVIPSVHGILPKTCKFPLLSANINDSIIVERVFDQHDFLAFMDKENIRIGSKITVIARDDFNGVIDILIDGKATTLSTYVASNIFGHLINQ